MSEHPHWVRLLGSLCRPVAGRLMVAALAGFAAASCGIGLMATSAWLISRAATRPPILHLMVAIVAVRAFGLGRGVLRYIERLAGHDATLRILPGLRIRVFKALAELIPARWDGHHRGDLLQRMVSDVDAVLDVVVRVVLPYLVALGVAVGSVVLVGSVLPVAGFALAAALAVVAVGLPALGAVLARKADGRISPLRGKQTAVTIDLLQGLPDLLAYGALPRWLEQADQASDQLRRARARSSATTGLSAALGSLAFGACLLVGLSAGWAALRAGALDGELLAVVVLTPLAVSEAVAGLPVAAQQLLAARTSLVRIASLLRTAQRRPAGSPAATSTELPEGPLTVEMRGVWAAWQPDRPALRGVDLVIKPGERVGLVGRSGSGKTTVAALLVRFLDPQRGSITINDTDLLDLDPEQVRQLVQLCDDQAYLFDSTIEANLRIGAPDATGEQLREALAAAKLLGWVDSLPRGMATAVGEHGVRLSGGQRRRLALARALLADRPVLVLDEPTEHLDEETAQQVIRDVLEATRGRTLLLITHRLTGLQELDQVISIEDGKVCCVTGN